MNKLSSRLKKGSWSLSKAPVLRSSILFPNGFPQKGEIYQINFSPSRGKEIKEIHPGLVVSNNIQNEYGHYVIVAPITSTLKRERLFELIISPSFKNGLEKRSKILLNQIRSIDKRRLAKYLGQVEPEVMFEVRKKIDLVLD
ncbi:plasmid maintenance toxin/Cell growth inhibitor [Glomus cerebriforme]|uniref:Plasmid maintenance toxin/Cell growth inhibitor n=1 Tax=Glomus cerebriforme TaxID=658196 RepID=A0A397SWB1_9GLOM|nr:plasmid maintenance toxin/Cell growth inhibitor [Glomus cerebriforme]